VIEIFCDFRLAIWSNDDSLDEALQMMTESVSQRTAGLFVVVWQFTGLHYLRFLLTVSLHILDLTLFLTLCPELGVMQPSLLPEGICPP
jgi:hypothetical protein